MSKKIIAVIAIVTVLFVSVFAACKKNGDEEIYIEHKDLNLVTDENGEKILGTSGEFLVYATDDDGDRVTKENGEYVTLAQEFQPIEDDGVVEDYGFKFNLPEGWKSTSTFGLFENKEKTQNIEISVVQYTYKDYYKHNKDFYQKLKSQTAEGTVKWEENVDLGEDFKNVCRFTMTTEEGTSVLYFFANSNNVYKILFNTADSANANADSEALCKAITFKGYTYYPNVTSVTTTVASTKAPATTAVAE